MSFLKKTVIGGLFILLTTSAVSASEYRCGWLENPSPSNFWLTDNAGTWYISMQGGYHVKDRYFNRLPKINPNEYVRTNANYGYSCACLSVKTNKKKRRITKIYKKGKSLLLKRCLEDPKLSFPGK